jgi:hypothetical protein
MGISHRPHHRDFGGFADATSGTVDDAQRHGDNLVLGDSLPGRVAGRDGGTTMSLVHDYVFLRLHRQRHRDQIAQADHAALARTVRRSPSQSGSTDDGPTATTKPRFPEHWNVTAAEVAATYPCDRLAPPPIRSLTRGIDVNAPAPVVFRWLCQLKVAPYSYDWIDHLGRPSPRTLTPGVERLARGQRFLIAKITEFVENEHITGRAITAAERLFGVAAVTYRVSARSDSTSRLVVRLVVHDPVPTWAQVRFRLLAWGDLIMMHKQLSTLQQLAEQTAAEWQPMGS